MRTVQIFLQKYFQGDLLLNLGDQNNNYLEFEKYIVEPLHKHAPKKTKVFRGNSKLHVIKSLRKAIMKLIQLKKKVKDPEDILKHKK